LRHTANCTENRFHT
jgi:hypothetical protein